MTKCRECKYIPYTEFADVCTYHDELIRYDDEVCEYFERNRGF